MLFESLLSPPREAAVFDEQGRTELSRGGEGVWQADGIDVIMEPSGDALEILLRAPRRDVYQIVLSWPIRIPAGARFLNDHWERGYGDLEWRGLSAERFFPWYLVGHHGGTTSAAGVKVRPRAFCHWQVTPSRLSLVCDVRSGRSGVRLGDRTLRVASVVHESSTEGRPFEAVRRFCARLCDDPRLPKAPAFGFNDWYYAYGSSTRETILRDAALLAELAPSGGVRPYCAIDAGWQVLGGYDGGPWTHGNRLFGDMTNLARDLRNLGVRPGIWIRPLATRERVPASWTPRQDGSGVALLDPSVPDVLDYVAGTVATLVDWGYELIKHDFSTYDVFGAWGFEMGPGITSERTLAFADRARTTAEILLDLYQRIRGAAGDALVLGCNTVGHLAAGLVDIQRTGDDTSGREWARTLKMGVNTLAFRMPQHGAFFAADADCVGLTPAIPWRLNAQWLDLLSRSGTPVFVSAAPEAIGPEQRNAVKAAFVLAAHAQPPAEPLDWLDTTIPAQWRFGAEEQEFDWWTT